jgi:hypothetical protein
LAEENEEKFRPLLRAMAIFGQRHRFRLRIYQEEIADRVIEVVEKRLGLSLVVMMPRQSGKNELQAQLEASLLLMYAREPVDIVKISPTWRPQCLNAIHRLVRVLEANPLTQTYGFTRESGHILRVGKARISFFSGEPRSNIVGATASLLLEVDEAQSVGIEKFDTQIAPMAASTNAARVFWGTAWTADTLLAREMRAAMEGELQDGQVRSFRRDADIVGKEVSDYARFVEGQVARLGRNHPAVRTQFFSEEIGAKNALFSPEQLAMAQGEHAWQEGPRAGEAYVFLIDVGGEALGENIEEERQKHDATALVIAAVDLEGLRNPAVGGPVYKVVWAFEWQGVGQPALQARILALARSWNARRLVVDATGLGAGLAAGLERALRGRVIRRIFTAANKSRLGWDFIAALETGRFRLPRIPAGEGASSTGVGASPGGNGGRVLERLWAQMKACSAEVGPGEDKPLRWSVPDGARGPQGEVLHDDLLVAAALCTTLDGIDWAGPGGGWVVQGRDPLKEMDRERY